MEQSYADPELAPLLAEVVGDRSSTLLRVTPKQLRHMLVESDPRPGAVQSLLSKAEQRLLEAHKEDVARLLLRASQWMLYHDPIWENVLHRSISIDRKWEFAEKHELVELARVAQREWPQNTPVPTPLEELCERLEL